MKDKIIELIDEFEERLKSLKEEYNGEGFKFKCGDAYWVLDSIGEVMASTWFNSEYDNERLKNNAIFETYEEAKFEAERLKVLRELEKLGRAFKPNRSNFSICLLHDSRDNQKKLFYKLMTEVEHVYGDYYFDSLPKAKDAVYRIGEERIMKYLFRAED